MQAPIQKINATIEPLRQEIVNHPIYPLIRDLEDLRLFMRYHVYAVWDFMSLLKALQNELTCTTVPWFPKGDADTRHLINEIVVGEESDIDDKGQRKSHFELYLDAMSQCGADTTEMRRFIAVLQQTGDLQRAFDEAGTPQEAQDFVKFTFSTIGSRKAHLQAAVFTFGREDLIPGMFMSIINDIHQNFPDSISTFKYYLERHIEVDGDHHSHLALQMTSNLCGTNDEAWKEAETATIESLKMRIRLWNGVHNQINARRTTLA